MFNNDYYKPTNRQVVGGMANWLQQLQQQQQQPSTIIKVGIDGQNSEENRPHRINNWNETYSRLYNRI